MLHVGVTLTWLLCYIIQYSIYSILYSIYNFGKLFKIIPNKT